MGLFSNKVSRRSLKRGDHIYSWRLGGIYAHHGIYVGNDTVIHFTRRGQEVGTGTKLDSVLISSAKSQKPCPTCTPQEMHGVVISCLNCFLSGGSLYRFEYAVNPALFVAKVRGGTCTLAVSDPNNIVVRRAYALLRNSRRRNGFGCENNPNSCYNLFKNNCENFAMYCKTGLVAVTHKTIGQSGQIISYIAVPVAAIFGMPSLFIAGNACGTAASFASLGMGVATTGLYAMAATATGFGAIGFIGAYCMKRYISDMGIRKDVEKVEVDELTRKLAEGLFRVGQP